MLIKSADDKTKDIDALHALLAHPGATPEIRQRVEREIRNIRSGLKGEGEAAYELDFHFTSRNWMVIHDLRLEHDGRVAQIDHLVLNRFLDMYVCESKRFSEGVAINEQGEFSAFFGSRPYGIPSPLEQNKRHILVLETLFRDEIVRLPRRLGFTLKPHIQGYVLVSKSARISRPQRRIDELESVVKADQFVSKVARDVDNGSPLGMAKLVGQDTLEDLARQFAGLHCPVTFDWAGKFGLSEASAPPLSSGEKAGRDEGVSAAPQEKAKSKLVCTNCSAPVNYAVAKFCWNNRRFGGKVYCRDCQTSV